AAERRARSAGVGHDAGDVRTEMRGPETGCLGVYNFRGMPKGIIAAVALCSLLYAQSDYSSAEADVRNGRPEQAIPVLQRILAQSPSDLKARNLLGIALMNAGRKEE